MEFLSHFIWLLFCFSHLGAGDVSLFHPTRIRWRGVCDTERKWQRWKVTEVRRWTKSSLLIVNYGANIVMMNTYKIISSLGSWKWGLMNEECQQVTHGITCDTFSFMDKRSQPGPFCPPEDTWQCLETSGCFSGRGHLLSRGQGYC